MRAEGSNHADHECSALVSSTAASLRISNEVSEGQGSVRGGAEGTITPVLEVDYHPKDSVHQKLLPSFPEQTNNFAHFARLDSKINLTSQSSQCICASQQHFKPLFA